MSEYLEQVKIGLMLRKSIGGAHFLVCVIGGGFVHENGRVDPAWECRDCGAVVTLDEEARWAWRQWVTWTIMASEDVRSAASRPLKCGGSDA